MHGRRPCWTLPPLLALLVLAGCQQSRQPQADIGAVYSDPPASGAGVCPSLTPDWLAQLPAHQRRIEPAECSRHVATPLFAWGDPRNRLPGSPYTLVIRAQNGGMAQQTQVSSEARARLVAPLASGGYEWAVSYTHAQGHTLQTQWRRFDVEGNLRPAATSAALTTAQLIDGATFSAQLSAGARPRMLGKGTSWPRLKAAVEQGEHRAVLLQLRTRAQQAAGQTPPASPEAQQPTPTASALSRSARSERFAIENLALLGRLDGNANWLSQARTRTLALANWSPTGASGHAAADQANREVFLALAQGLDLFWSEFTESERSRITAALRARVLQTQAAVTVLDRDPYDSHSQSHVRYLVQALMLASGAPGFAEAPALLARNWDLSLHQTGIWGRDGSFGNGVAYAWYQFNSLVPYAAAVRVVAGLDLYALPEYRRAGEMLVAFTPPAWPQPSAFGDEMETRDLYDQYSASSYRLHAQLSRDPIDAWYWRAKPANISSPNDALIWQVLLLGQESPTRQAVVPPTRHDWFSQDSGWAAMHTDIHRRDRSSVFFRSSRFGAYNHSHADQNSLVYVSQGQPLLINAGHYPYYNSPHHKNTRATRFKNALTFDGGFGQSENLTLGSAKPTDPFHMMDAAGALIYTASFPQVAAATGDATAAYGVVDPNRGTMTRSLSNAVRSVVVDKANGVTLVYDWATSSTPRQWELNFHSPQPFEANAATVRAQGGSASVCLDRYGPASSFAQTQAWEVAPESPRPAQAHGRFTLLARSAELAHLFVLREGCRVTPVQVQHQGSIISVTVNGRMLAQFNQRALQLNP